VFSCGILKRWSSNESGFCNSEKFLYSSVETCTRVFVSCEFVIMQEVVNKMSLLYSGFKLYIFRIFVSVQFICHYNLLMCLPSLNGPGSILNDHVV
jgi:hypothetical protein